MPDASDVITPTAACWFQQHLTAPASLEIVDVVGRLKMWYEALG